MTAAEDLNAMADQMAGILSQFSRTSDGVYIAEGDQAKFTGLVIEARDLLGQTLGPANTIGLQLEQTRAGIPKFHWLTIVPFGRTSDQHCAISGKRIAAPNGDDGCPSRRRAQNTSSIR